jgi:hypothetical protein
LLALRVVATGPVVIGGQGVALGRVVIWQRLRLVAALLDRGHGREALGYVRALANVILERRVLSGADHRQLELPLKVAPHEVVAGCPLGIGIRAGACVARQIAGDKRQANANRAPELARHDGKRGHAPEEPHCITARCETGAWIREHLVTLQGRRGKHANHGEMPELQRADHLGGDDQRKTHPG